MPRKKTTIHEGGGHQIVFDQRATTKGADGRIQHHPNDQIWTSTDCCLQFRVNDQYLNRTNLVVKLKPKYEGNIWMEHIDDHSYIWFNITQTGSYELDLKIDGKNVKHNLGKIEVKKPCLDLENTIVEYGKMYDQEKYAYDNEDVMPLPNVQFCFHFVFVDEIGNEIEHALDGSEIEIKNGSNNVNLQKGQNYISEEAILFWTPEFAGRFTIIIAGIKLTTDIEVEGIIEFDEDSINMQSEGDSRRIIMYNTEYYNLEPSDIKGGDLANTENIKRVTEIYIKSGDVTSSGNGVVAEFKSDDTKKATKVKKMLSLILKGMHYRAQATYHENRREHFKNMSQMSYQADDFEYGAPTILRQFKSAHASLMEDAHELAKKAYFEFHNTKRELSEIDLHDLRAYDDSKKRVVGEAIEMLDKRMNNKQLYRKHDWLEIIVGAGHHSKGKQILRSAVEDYLSNCYIPEDFVDLTCVNKGALLVTFRRYEGPEPCFGHFYCTHCDHEWWSHLSWVNYWQICYKCDKKDNKGSKCYPHKMSKRSPKLGRKEEGSKGKRGSIPHDGKMCQKCKELKSYCGRFASE